MNDALGNHLNLFVFNLCFRALYSFPGILSRFRWFTMNGKEKFKEEMEVVEDAETFEEEGHSSEKATAKHVENKVPYWDTPYVIGASRDLQSSSSISKDNVKRPGCTRRLWLHYKRHWILYTILAVLALAAGLPIL
jgi:hypothetical protein